MEDLDEIAEYIALDKPSAAVALVQKILTLTEQLAAFPRKGRRLPELPKTRYRELIVPPCRIVYLFSAPTVHIVRVIRSERLLQRSMLPNA